MRCCFYVPNMPAKNRGKIQPLGHIFGTLCLQGKFTPFSTKLEMAHQTYIGGAACWGMAGHGWACLGAVWGAPRHPQPFPNKQTCPIFINLSRFHQIFLINSDLLMNLGGIWWERGAVLELGSHRPSHVGREFVGKNL